jgi:Tol biopolymer transport system component
MSPLLPLLATAAAAPMLVSAEHGGNAQAPTWSPSGDVLTYEVAAPTGLSISLFRARPGSPPEPVVRRAGRRASDAFQRRAAAEVSHEVAWAPPGTDAFVYAHGLQGGDRDLVLDSGGALAAAPGPDGGPAWSADGRWIVFTSARTGQGDLYRLDLDQPDAPPARLTRDPDASEVFAAIAPDSRRLVFTAHTPRGDNLLLMEDLTRGSMPVVLTPWPGEQTRPSWSPDGARIAFYANTEDRERWDLLTLTPGGEATVLARGVVPDRQGPAWTPDSRSIVYVQDDDDRFDPIQRVSVLAPERPLPVQTGTVGNRDVSVVRRSDGQTWLAFVAQGLEGDAVRAFHRVYAQPLR